MARRKISVGNIDEVSGKFNIAIGEIYKGSDEEWHVRLQSSVQAPIDRLAVDLLKPESFSQKCV